MGSPGWTRTNDSPLNRRVLCQLSYRGSQPPIVGHDVLPANFWTKVDASGECWIWTGAISQNGYGSFSYRGSIRSSHSVAYEAFVGAVPSELELDHLCRVRACCNPSHLEAVTAQENVRRGVGPSAVNATKTECPQGHPYSGDNLYVHPRGERRCLICQRAMQRAYRARRSA